MTVPYNDYAFSRSACCLSDEGAVCPSVRPAAKHPCGHLSFDRRSDHSTSSGARIRPPLVLLAFSFPTMDRCTACFRFLRLVRSDCWLVVLSRAGVCVIHFPGEKAVFVALFSPTRLPPPSPSFPSLDTARLFSFSPCERECLTVADSHIIVILDSAPSYSGASLSLPLFPLKKTLSEMSYKSCDESEPSAVAVCQEIHSLDSHALHADWHLSLAQTGASASASTDRNSKPEPHTQDVEGEGETTKARARRSVVPIVESNGSREMLTSCG